MKIGDILTPSTVRRSKRLRFLVEHNYYVEIIRNDHEVEESS